ncbi:hypothetical protein CPB85DRAFT_1255003 [Mucidula mucida]|nr:hypothetical protein CPB85DRAFT_1255003 [Mucidula mucida]
MYVSLTPPNATPPTAERKTINSEYHTPYPAARFFTFELAIRKDHKLITHGPSATRATWEARWYKWDMRFALRSRDHGFLKVMDEEGRRDDARGVWRAVGELEERCAV